MDLVYNRGSPSLFCVHLSSQHQQAPASINNNFHFIFVLRRLWKSDQPIYYRSRTAWINPSSGILTFVHSLAFPFTGQGKAFKLLASIINNIIVVVKTPSLRPQGTHLPRAPSRRFPAPTIIFIIDSVLRSRHSLLDRYLREPPITTITIG